MQRIANDKKYTPKGAGGKALTEIPGLRKVPNNYSEQYASNFAELWAVWLLTRSGVDDVHREQFLMWLEEQLDTNVSYRDFVTALIAPCYERVSQLDIQREGADGTIDTCRILTRIEFEETY